MIEVAAKLKRGSVFFAAETLHCQITFTNVGDPENNDVTTSPGKKYK